MASPDKEWVTVVEAAEIAGCTVGWIRLLLGKGKLEGWKAGERAWLVRRTAAVKLRGTLTDASVGKRDGAASKKAKRKTR